MSGNNEEKYVVVSRWYKEEDAPTNYSILKFVNKTPEWIDEYLKKNFKYYNHEFLPLQVVD